MSGATDREALYALSEERGGQLLMEHCEREIDRVERGWLSLLRGDTKILPDEGLLYVQLLKSRADREAYRRVLGMLTDPSKERRDE
jgi:hypothetical protein